jgi:CBS-domain-containing membrane protein
MAKTVADLDLDDEHITIGLEDSMSEAARRLLTINGGILIVLDDHSKTKGVIGNRQLLKSLAENIDAESEKCSQWMEMDFLETQLDTPLKELLSMVQDRSPQAVVAVDDEGDFYGYFSPKDYKDATRMLNSLKNLNL